MRRFLLIAIVWAVAALGSTPVRAQEAAPAGTPEISRVRGDVYLACDGQLCTVFLVTGNGIVLGDPLGRPFALWLRDEVRARFKQEVRFVLHTHHHYARAAGSSVFNDTAEIVTQVAFTGAILDAQHERPERYRFAFRATVRFSRERAITLGGQTVTAIHLPMSGSPEMTVLHFQRERIVFAAESPGIGNAPFSFGTFTPRDVFAWIDTLGALEFDSLVLGDGRIVSRAQFDELATYLRALRAAVSRGIGEDLTLSPIQSAATLDQFRANPHYAKRASQLSDIYAAAAPLTVWASAGAAGNYTWLAPAFCASETACEGGGAVPSLRFTISTPSRKRLGLVGELTLSGQAWSARTNVQLDQDAVTRRSRGALLVRYSSRPSKFSYALVGGPSLTVDDVQGIDRVKDALVPTGGYHPFAEHNNRFGVTFGGDLQYRLNGSLAIRLPIRITRSLGATSGSYVDSAFDVQAGIDVTVRAFHKVSFR